LKLLLATHNEHKRRELERMLAGATGAVRWELDVLPTDVELPPEDGETFAANALGKARAAAAATGRVSIADDSGICAAALDGAPGVRSARYAGEHASDTENLEKLRREVPVGGALEYVCAIAYVQPDGLDLVFEGRCAGRMAAQARGDRGFGYDPTFLPDEYSSTDDDPPGQTMAELSDEQKDLISHRGQAARALLEWLESRSAPSAG
jgi:XTP/dITP diphosphohydrolase